MAPTIRTAAVDCDGHLWISFVEPITYEFDADGDKIRTVQFRAAGLLSPNSLFFQPGGRLLVTPGLYMFDVGADQMSAIALTIGTLSATATEPWHRGLVRSREQPQAATRFVANVFVRVPCH